MSDATNQSQGAVSPIDFVALSAGRMIGRYEVVSVLGQGGFGITYRAHDSQLGARFADVEKRIRQWGNDNGKAYGFEYAEVFNRAENG